MPWLSGPNATVTGICLLVQDTLFAIATNNYNQLVCTFNKKLTQ
jgi:hypothetical protein